MLAPPRHLGLVLLFWSAVQVAQLFLCISFVKQRQNLSGRWQYWMTVLAVASTPLSLLPLVSACTLYVWDSVTPHQWVHVIFGGREWLPICYVVVLVLLLPFSL